MATRLTSGIGMRSLSQQNEGSTLAFFLVPTLLVAAVFAFCALAQSTAEDEAPDAKVEAKG